MDRRASRQGFVFAPLAALAALGLFAVYFGEPADASFPHGADLGGADRATAPAGGAVDATAKTAIPPAPLIRAEAAASARLRVVDAADGSALGGACVELGCPEDAMAGFTLFTDDGGDAHLPQVPDCTVALHVAREGYVPLRGELVLMAPRTTVALERAGVARVRVVDERGRPAAGVEVALLPPPTAPRDWSLAFGALLRRGAPLPAAEVAAALEPRDGVLHASAAPVDVGGGFLVSGRFVAQSPWTRRTDVEGVATFHGLAPATGYRWAVLGRHHAEVTPPFERQRLRVTDDGVVVQPAGIADLSGPFALEPGEVTELDGTLVGAATVRGMLACAGNSVRAQVRLCRIRQAGGDGVTAVTTVDPELVVATAADGSFEFTDVRPGILAVRSCWLENGRDVRFASTTIRLAPGAYLDLGTLGPRCGATIAVRVGLRDGAGPVAVESVFARPDTAAALLNLAVNPDNQVVADGLAELMLVPFGQELVLHGLPPGRLLLEARPAAGVETLPSIAGVEAPAAVDRRLEELGELVELDVTVIAGVTCTVDFRDPMQREVDVELVHVCERGSGRADSVEVRLADPAPLRRRTITLPAGDYELVAVTAVGEVTLGGHARADLRRAPDGPVTLTMAPTASIEGRLVDARGAPLAGRELRWSPHRWAAAGVWLFGAAAAADGAFELQGLPPGLGLAGANGLEPIGPLQPGQALAGWTLVAER